MFLVSQTDASHQVPSSSPLALVPVIAFVPQPPFAQQAVQGANAQNLTQTFFFAAQSKTLTDGVPDALQLSFQIGKANSVPTDTPCFPALLPGFNTHSSFPLLASSRPLFQGRRGFCLHYED